VIISAEKVTFQRDGAYLAAADTDEVETVLKVDLTDVKPNWDFAVSVTGETFSVTATGKGAAAALKACCTYSRVANPVWNEDADCP
jgi:hypothetical protein